jgi:hypothetical protein
MSEPIAVTGQTGTFRQLADGRVFATFVIDPEKVVTFAQYFCEQGQPVAIALLNAEMDRERRLVSKASENKSEYGEQAKELKLNGFFRRPDVWKAVGSDDCFLLWLRSKPCAAKRMGKCGGDIVAAHVRRIANGAGTARKPEHSAIALCHEHHTLQHAKGEDALGGEAWFDVQRIKHVEEWAWVMLKEQLGYESFAQVPPSVLCDWAIDKGVVKFLPECYIASVDSTF